MDFSMQIREASPDDATIMKPLLEALGYHQSAEDLETHIKHCNRLSNYKILLAFDGTLLTGLITFYLIEQFFVPKRKIHVEALVTEKSYKRKGVGRALLQETEKYALSKNCSLIELFSNKSRAIEGTYDFYFSLGYGNSGKKEVGYFKKHLN